MKIPDYLKKHGSQYLLQGFPVLGMPDKEREVKYFSLNPFLPDERNRCPLDCSDCVCHQDSHWHHRPGAFTNQSIPRNLIADLLDIIYQTEEGQKGHPISLCDYSDPFIPVHKPRVLKILRQLIQRSAISMIYITTKVHPGLNFLQELR